MSVSVAVSEYPLVVDLDGTLIQSDILVESFFELLSSRPLRALASLRSLGEGRAAFKARLANEVTLDLSTLPFNEELLAFLRAEKARGRRVYLASAAHESCVKEIAARLGLFDGVFASDGKNNLKGKAKADALCAAFGHGGFDYAGNDQIDLAVWSEARGAIAVNASAKLIWAVRQRFGDVVIISPRRADFAEYGRALRLHQWLKNLLVFVPAFTAHHFEGTTILACCIAFLSFSLCASSVYLVNDLLDLRSDRDHPTKRHRPLAAGRLGVFNGIILVPTTAAAAVMLALLLPWQFFGTLAVYCTLTLSYSLYIKRKIMLDVVALACLYGMRLWAGAAAVSVPLSPWLLSFALFLFLSLALVKRWTELSDRAETGKGDPVGRGYRVSDLPVIQAMATASGYIAVMIFGLYINSTTVVQLYARPGYLWAIPVILLYWISRILLLTHRGEMHDDPVLFAATDRTSLLCAGLIGLVVGVSGMQ
ncbi:MAG TPA: UbiA family prenyltransferase [Aliidongia sp.]|nr:UbiA family prenyltransferase [Aliidongia sp.]